MEIRKNCFAFNWHQKMEFCLILLFEDKWTIPKSGACGPGFERRRLKNDHFEVILTQNHEDLAV
ncbi:MAG: hypothetical protein LBL44_12845 [Treponema sp.]|nr:hypothetical protein [Treponema sp.]